MAKVPAGYKSYLGFIVNGDLAGETFYTSRRGYVVAFPKSPPLTPATIAQSAQRNKFRAGAAAWRQLTKEVKAKWMLASKRAKLRMNGYALFQAWRAQTEDSYIRTIEHQTGISLIP